MATSSASGGAVPRAADCFVIEGGHPLKGTVAPAGNKNEALPILAASLLVPADVTVDNLPRIGDVMVMIEALADLGVRVSFTGSHGAHLDATRLLGGDPDPLIASRIRGSLLLAPGLLARTGRAVLPPPGGDRIGRRRIDAHLAVLQALGARVESVDPLRLSLAGRFRGAEIFLEEASVTATENAIMAAAVAEGATEVLNAASEPHVQGLCRFLVGAGARIEGIGSNHLCIQGVDALRPVRHRLCPDHIEVGSWIALAAMTGGELAIRDVVPADLRMIRLVFHHLGVETRDQGSALLVPGRQELRVVSDVGGAIRKVDDGPWPAFPADLTSLALVLATQCRGTVLIHEKLFESRLYFVDHLITMGAQVVLCDPHRAVVIGPSALRGATLTSPDIRAGMALIGAALCAQGRSVIMNASQVDRGYERIDERLRAVGANITR